MSQIERIQTLLASKGINADLKDSGTELMTFISTGPIGSRLAIGELHGMLRVSVLIPLYVPNYRRTELALAVSRANWALIGGSFRMDHEDGEVRYECFLPVLDGTVTDEQLSWLIHGSWTVASRYALAFMEVAVSAANAEEAISRADASFREEARAAAGVVQ